MAKENIDLATTFYDANTKKITGKDWQEKKGQNAKAFEKLDLISVSYNANISKECMEQKNIDVVTCF